MLEWPSQCWSGPAKYRSGPAKFKSYRWVAQPALCMAQLAIWWGGWWPIRFSCQPQSLLVLDFIGTWLGLGLGGFGTKDLGTGLDNC